MASVRGGVSSVFDPAAQHENVDAKIVVALERLSQAFRTLLWDKAKDGPAGYTLSPIQIQILIHLRFHGPAFRRVGRLAREFDVTPATVSDAVRVLEEKGLLRKERSPEDKRVQVLQLTPDGEKVVDGVGDWADVMRSCLRSYDDAEKVLVMRFLMYLIEQLQEAGHISVTRMCTTCRFFRADGSNDPAAPHFCALLEKPLRREELRVDCPEHEVPA